ncbi:hypothetical protein BJ742DRAFT_739600 [Cladochytrium replicatum]|nr:hypothetical protein BJ742DRAFT_739600 [Cladochytrium replicatum]
MPGSRGLRSILRLPGAVVGVLDNELLVMRAGHARAKEMFVTGFGFCKGGDRRPGEILAENAAEELRNKWKAEDEQIGGNGEGEDDDDDDDEEEINKWWETLRSQEDSSVKWTTLEHNGITRWREKKKNLVKEEKAIEKAGRRRLRPVRLGARERTEERSVLSGLNIRVSSAVAKRVMPEQITINIGEGAKIPDPPAGHQWGETRHDNTVTWLATWKDNVNNQTKYVFLAADSSVKGQSDTAKFEKARGLKLGFDAGYQRSGPRTKRTRWDAVRCRDMFRSTTTVKLDAQVIKNLQTFKKAPKKPGDELFDCITSPILATSSAAAAKSALTIGDRVTVKTSKKTGTLRFLGPTQFAEGTWAGIELDDLGAGKNNGSVNGVAYFSCPDNSGVFVSSAHVEKIVEKPAAPAAHTAKRVPSSSSVPRPKAASSTKDASVPNSVNGSTVSLAGAPASPAKRSAAAVPEKRSVSNLKKPTAISASGGSTPDKASPGTISPNRPRSRLSSTAVPPGAERIEALETENNALKEELNKLRNALADASPAATYTNGSTELVESLHAQIADLESRLSSSQAEYESVLASHSAAQNDLISKLESVTNELEILKSTPPPVAAAPISNGDVEGEIAKWKEVCAEKDATIENIQKHFREEIAELEKQIASARGSGDETDELKRLLDGKEVVIQSLKSQVEDGESKWGQIQKEVEELRANVQKDGARVESLQLQLEALNTEKAELTHKLAAAVSGEGGDSEAMAAQVEMLKATLSTAVHDAEEGAVKLAAKDEVIAELHRQVDALAGERDSRIAELEARYVEVEATHAATIKGFETKIAELEASASKLPHLERSLQEIRDQSAEELRDLRAMVETLTVEKGDLQVVAGSVSEKEVRIIELETSLAAAEAKLSETGGSDERVTDLETQLADKNAKIADLERIVEETEGQTESAKAALLQLKAEWEVQDAQLKEESSKCAELDSKLAAAYATIAELQFKSDSSNDDAHHAAVTARIVELEAQVSDLQTMLESMPEKDSVITSLQSNIPSTTEAQLSALEALQATTAALQARITELEKQRETLDYEHAAEIAELQSRLQEMGYAKTVEVAAVGDLKDGQMSDLSAQIGVIVKRHEEAMQAKEVLIAELEADLEASRAIEEKVRALESELLVVRGGHALAKEGVVTVVEGGGAEGALRAAEAAEMPVASVAEHAAEEVRSQLAALEAELDGDEEEAGSYVGEAAVEVDEEVLEEEEEEVEEVGAVDHGEGTF